MALPSAGKLIVQNAKQIKNPKSRIEPLVM